VLDAEAAQHQLAHRERRERHDDQDQGAPPAAGTRATGRREQLVGQVAEDDRQQADDDAGDGGGAHRREVREPEVADPVRPVAHGATRGERGVAAALDHPAADQAGALGQARARTSRR
jgi:hypothetical protein